VRVVRKDESGEVLLDVTEDLTISTSNSWSDYFWGDSVYRNDLRVPLPLAFTGTVVVTLNNPGGTAKCGVLFAGKDKYLGETEYGISSGIRDYSRKTTDSDGNATLEQGAYSKRMNLSMNVEDGAYDAVQRYLTAMRGKPAAWLADEDDNVESFFIHGYISDFELVFQDLDDRTCSLTIEGLI
jgi:hypothetical protein